LEKIDKKHCLIWNMARNTEKVENEKCIRQDLEYGEKLQFMDNEKHTL
jgi:hypothetical protein